MPGSYPMFKRSRAPVTDQRRQRRRYSRLPACEWNWNNRKRNGNINIGFLRALYALIALRRISVVDRTKSQRAQTNGLVLLSDETERLAELLPEK